jgi:hypothetical protein
MTPGDTGQPISDDLPTKIPQRILAELSAKIASSIEWPGLRSFPCLIFTSNSPDG